MKTLVHKTFALLLCMALVLSAASCGGKSETQKQKEGGAVPDTLNVAISGDNGTLIPCKVVGGFVGVVRQYAETLFDYTIDGKIVWCLATGVDEVSTSEWIIHLREGVKFSNGNEFDANDLMFTIQYYMSDPTLAAQFSSIDVSRSEVIDKYTFRLAIGAYSSMLMGSLSQMYMMDGESFNEDEMVTKPIGTGPYVVDEYVVNSHLYMVANENYWGAKPKIKNLHFKILNEEAQIVNALETGVVDVASVPAQNIELVKTFENYELVSYYSLFTPTIDFNITEHSIMNDVNARLAVCHAINRQAIVDLVYFGNATVLDYPVSMYCHDYTDDLANLHETYSIGYDVELARQYAEKAGLVGKTITVITNGQPTYVAEAEIIQLNLKEIGVNVEIKNYDTASYWSIAYDPTMFDISLYAVASPQGYAVGMLYEFPMWSNAIKNGWEKYEQYLALGAQAVANPDPESRKEMLMEMSKMFEEGVLWYGICDMKSTVAVNKNLEGVQLWNSGMMHYGDWSWKA